MVRVETVIVGAGLSGLACAALLEKHKKEYLIVEKSNRVGGWVGSIYENDYIFDVGFQVYNTAYAESSRIFDLKNIDLQLFKQGSVIHNGWYIFQYRIKCQTQINDANTNEDKTNTVHGTSINLKYSA